MNDCWEHSSDLPTGRSLWFTGEQVLLECKVDYPPTFRREWTSSPSPQWQVYSHVQTFSVSCQAVKLDLTIHRYIENTVSYTYFLCEGWCTLRHGVYRTITALHPSLCIRLGSMQNLIVLVVLKYCSRMCIKGLLSHEMTFCSPYFFSFPKQFMS